MLRRRLRRLIYYHKMELFALFAVAALLLLVAQDIQRGPAAREDAIAHEIYVSLSKSVPALYHMNATEVLQLRYGVINETTARQACNGVSERDAAWCARKGLIDAMASCSGPLPSRGFPPECDALRERISVFMRQETPR